MDEPTCLATPFSAKPYYPYLLVNGNDVIPIGYSGTMITGITCHIHTEQHQNTIPAWHKLEHRRKNCASAPIIISGYQVYVDGEVCEPTDFAQHFEPRSAVLTSQVKFRCGVELRIETLLTADGVLVYEFEVLSSQTEKLAIAFTLLAPYSYRGTGLFETPAPEVKFSGNSREINFTYHFPKSGISGTGALRCDRTDGVPCESSWGVAPGLRFEGVKAGWKGTMYTLCADAPAALPEIAPDWRQRHEEVWSAYFQTSDIRLPDPELQYFYDLSRYIIKGAQHRQGGIVCGFLPHMWDGGTCCPCDAEFSFQAFLQTNNLEEARRHLQYYLDQYDAGEELVRSFGFQGTAFSNWSNVLGEHCSRDLAAELTKRKPVMVAIIGIAAGEYCLYADAGDAGAKKLLHGCADFIESGFIRDGQIADTAAGNESDIEVSRDSFMLAVAIRVLELDARFNRQPQRAETAAVLRRQLELNRDSMGIILPWENAGYYSAMPLWSQHYLRGLHSAGQVAAFRDSIRTPWGTDGDQPSEVYRDWSWDNPLFAREFIREGDAAAAFARLKNFPRNAASSGALPEKIRLDGYAIGYWYQTVYAVFLQALCEAFGCLDGNTLYLLPGFDGEWRDFSAVNLRLAGGTLLSLTVSGGVITDLRLDGVKPEKIVVNPPYSLK